MTASADRLMAIVRQTMNNLARTACEIMNQSEKILVAEMLRDCADAIDHGDGERMKSPRPRSRGATQVSPTATLKNREK